MCYVCCTLVFDDGIDLCVYVLEHHRRVRIARERFADTAAGLVLLVMLLFLLLLGAVVVSTLVSSS